MLSRRLLACQWSCIISCSGLSHTHIPALVLCCLCNILTFGFLCLYLQKASRHAVIGLCSHLRSHMSFRSPANTSRVQSAPCFLSNWGIIIILRNWTRSGLKVSWRFIHDLSSIMVKALSVEVPAHFISKAIPQWQKVILYTEYPSPCPLACFFFF